MSLFSGLSLDYEIEGKLRWMDSRHSWIRFGERLGILAIVVCVCVLGLGYAVSRAHVVDVYAVAWTAAGIVCFGAFGFFVLALLSAIRGLSRERLAAAVETSHPKLLDRLNTLVHLEQDGRAPDDAFFERIEEQTRQKITTSSAADPFSRRSLLVLWSVFVALVVVTVGFYVYERPWRAIVFPASESALGLPDGAEDLAEVEPFVPEGDASAEDSAEPPWGEVRITEPGRDLKVTKVDVVPLQIEIATSEPIQKAQWFTAVTDQKETERGLPPPDEPNYAVYEPLVYVDELELSDWDVVSYYAAASAGQGERSGAYASEIYFLEIRPFREDILKMTGGEGGDSYRILNELSGLVDQQKHVLRETHAFSARVYDSEEQKRQDRDKLAEAESDLKEATRHLYAKIAAKMENEDIATVLEQLAKAEVALERSEVALREDAVDDVSNAIRNEQTALQELAATRKDFQKAVGEGAGSSESADSDERSPIADLSEKLEAIAEYRDEEKAVGEALEKLVQEQKRIAENVAGAAGSTGPGKQEQQEQLATEQEALSDELDTLAQEHSNLFRGSEVQLGRASASGKQAAKSVRENAERASSDSQKALEELEALGESVSRGQDGRRLADAYRLKEVVDQQAEALGQMGEGTGGVEPGAANELAETSKQTVRALKDVMDSPGMGVAFGDGVRKELSGESGRDREDKLDALAKADNEVERKRAATEAARSMEDLADSFDESAPTLAQELSGRDGLAPEGEGALAEALQKLGSLVTRLETGADLSPEDERKLREQALAEARAGVMGLVREGDPAAADRLLLLLEEELSGDREVSVDALRRLMDTLAEIQIEAASNESIEELERELRHIDVSQIPATYRERIRRYFEKLSRER